MGSRRNFALVRSGSFTSWRSPMVFCYPKQQRSLASTEMHRLQRSSVKKSRSKWLGWPRVSLSVYGKVQSATLEQTA